MNDDRLPNAETVSGYFTLERHIIGLHCSEIEATLGFPPQWLASGAHVFILERHPHVGEFLFAGSTRLPEARGLVPAHQRAGFPVPGAWYGERLVKIKPVRRLELPFPAASSPVEQWILTTSLYAWPVRTLEGSQRYWPFREIAGAREFPAHTAHPKYPR